MKTEMIELPEELEKRLPQELILFRKFVFNNKISVEDKNEGRN